MAKCAICEKAAHFGNGVSHSHRRSNKIWNAMPLRSFPVRRNRGRHFPFAEIPFAIPGGMPHRCRACAMPLRPRTAAVPDEPVPSGHLRISFRPSGPERGGAPGFSGHSASTKRPEKRQLAAAI